MKPLIAMQSIKFQIRFRFILAKQIGLIEMPRSVFYEFFSALPMHLPILNKRQAFMQSLKKMSLTKTSKVLWETNFYTDTIMLGMATQA